MTRQEIDKCRVKRVLIDTGAMKNIIYYKCFKEMGMNNSHLKPRRMVLEGFTAHKISVKGTVKVKVTLGSDTHLWKEEIKFYVVDIDSPYNAILGTPTHATFDLSSPPRINKCGLPPKAVWDTSRVALKAHLHT